MKKIISAVIATLVAMSFTAVVFASDAHQPVVVAEAAAVVSPAESAQTDVNVAKAEAKSLKAKEKADAKKAKAKVKADAKKAKAKVKADAKAAKAKAAADAKSKKELAPVAK